MTAGESSGASPWPIRLATATVAAGLATGLVGCTPTQETTPPDVTLSPDASDAVRLPRGVCLPPLVIADSLVREAAKTCLAAMDHGTVALVTYPGVSPDTSKAVAAGMETTMKKATAGLINITVTVVPASREAQDSLAKSLAATGKDCIDSQNTDGFASRIAENTMPELHASNFVVGVSGRAACNEAILGVADQPGGRDADVFLPDHRTGDAGAETTEQEILVATHELLHDYQLSHSGILSGQEPDGSHTELPGNGYTLGKNLDLKAYVATASHTEYNADGDDEMGLPTSIQRIVPNPMQVNRLLQPKVILEGPQAATAQSLDGGPMRFDTNTAQAGRFAMVKLSDPIKVKDEDIARVSDNQTTGHTFDTLAIVPYVGPDTGQIDGVKLYVYDSVHGANDLLGILERVGSGKATSQISYGSQVIEVQADGNIIQVRSLTPPVPAAG